MRFDYHATLSELMLEHCFRPLVAWSERRGMKARIQAHGSLADVMQAYGLAHIPEGENIFGGDTHHVNLRHRRLATSAAHVYGKPIVSAETYTWLRTPLFTTTLEMMKAASDSVFLDGINHIVNHGYSYSPPAAGEPGWAFYASTEVNHTNTWWRHYPHLARYVRRAQALLQQGAAVNEVGIYLPLADVFAQLGAGGILVDVEMERHLGTAFLTDLRRAGYDFDLVNDHVLAERARVSAGRLEAGTGAYRVIVVPGARWMPPESAARLAEFVQGGRAPRVRRAAAGGGSGAARPGAAEPPGARERRTPLGGDGSRGRGGGRRPVPGARRGSPMRPPRSGASVPSSVRTSRSCPARRRRRSTRTSASSTGATAPRTSISSPMSRRSRATSACASRRATASRSGGTPTPPCSRHPRTRTSPAPARGARRSSCGSTPSSRASSCSPPRPTARAPRGRLHARPERRWPSAAPGRSAWETVPALPLDGLRSWTELPRGAAYSGWATYATAFDMPSVGAGVDWEIDLGAVHETAEVWLNGRPLGAAWKRPRRLPCGTALVRGRNELRIEVANLWIHAMVERPEPPEWKTLEETAGIRWGRYGEAQARRPPPRRPSRPRPPAALQARVTPATGT